MTEELKTLQWNGWHHAFRRSAEEGAAAAWQKPEMDDHRRTARRMSAALEAEQPVLFPGEIIAFTRTVTAMPMIFSREEWEEIRKNHYIHELGNVSNLSPDYGRVIRSGLLALRERAETLCPGQPVTEEIDAVLGLTARYAAAAREAGLTDLARVLERVPAYGA